jgi:hypothetical protein
MAKSTSGGGITSNKLVSVGVKGGSRTTQVVSPRGLSQLGAAQGGKLTREGSFTGVNSSLPVFAGNKPAATALGNALTNNVGKGGPGTGRTTLVRGTQGVHGPVAGPNPIQGREILGAYGPETSNPSSLVRKR